MTLGEIDLLVEQQLVKVLINVVRFETDNYYYIGLAFGLFFMSFWMVENLYSKISHLFGATVFFMLQPGLYMFLPDLSRNFLASTYYIQEIHLYYFIVGAVVGALVTFLFKQLFDRVRDRVRHLLTKTTPFEKETLSDIRFVASQFSRLNKDYNATKYFKKRRMVFLGLSESKRARYIEQAKWRESHIQLMGTTGAGKGVLAGSLVYQACIQGEAIFAFNPKPDPWFPHVAGTAAEAAGVKLNILKLGGSRPQWNPVKNRSVSEIEEMLFAAFGLGERGTDADFYRLMDRLFASKFANFVVNKRIPFINLVEEFLIEYSEVGEKAPKFKSDLLEFSSLPFVNAIDGIDIDQEIIDGSLTNLDCSMRNTKIMKVQRAFAMSVIHALEKRDADSSRHVLLYLDEFKYLISSESLESIGAVRSAGCHIILAHQSLGDLRNCPADIDADSVVSSVMENCAIKLVYRVNHPETANLLSDMSGSIVSSTLIDEYELSNSLTEMKSDTRKLSQIEKPLIDTNMWMMLPPRCAVVLGDGLANYIFTSPVKVGKNQKWLDPTIYDDISLSNETTDLNAQSFGEAMIDVD